MAIYHGAYVDGDTLVGLHDASVGVVDPGGGGPGSGSNYYDVPRDTGAVTQAAFETDAGKSLALSLFSIGDQGAHAFWESNTTTTQLKTLFDVCYARGMYPVLDVSTYNFTLGNPSSLANPALAVGTGIAPNGALNPGAYDSAITAFFNGMRDYGKPWVLRMNVEHNSSDTYPYTFGKAWQASTRAQHEADFIAVWQKIYTLAQATGANTNCTWHWAPNPVKPYDVGSPTFDYLTEYYPGDAFVDWAGFVCYQIPPSAGVSEGDWSYLSSTTYSRITALTSKPLMVSEWGSYDEFTSAINGGVDTNKGDWQQHALDYVRLSQPQIKAMLIFDVNDGRPNEAFQSSTQARDGYRLGIAHSEYLGKQTTMATSGKLPLPGLTIGGAVYGSALYDSATYDGSGGSSQNITGVRAVAVARGHPGTIGGGVLSDYSSIVLADTPVSYWRLDDLSAPTAVDSRGLNNGTYTGSIQYSQTGLTGDSNKAITLSGGGYVSVGNPAGLQLNTMTVEAWFKTPSGNTEVIVGKAGVFVLYVKAGRLFTYDYGITNPGFVETDTGVTVNDNAAHHVAIVFQSSVVNGTRIYLDGVLVWTTTQTVHDQASEWEIGANAGTPFSGTLDEVAVYNYALPLNRIAAHAAGAPQGPSLVNIQGVPARATVHPHPGSVGLQGGQVSTTVTGVRALVYMRGAYGAGAYGSGPYGGDALLGEVTVNVTGVRATAAAAGRPGTVRLDVKITGVRATATAAGKPAGPQARPAQARAAATAVGKPGTVNGSVNITGVRAVAVAVGHRGSISINASVTSQNIVGVRARATATGRRGTVSVTYTVLFAAVVPTVAVLIDVTNNPTNPTRSWTDITHYVREVNLTRDGRSNETERTQPGNLTLLLDNRDGRFNKQNSAGAYYPNLKTTRWLKVQGVWAGVTYDRWTGLVDSVTQEWPADGADATATVQASTALKVLNLAPLGLNGATYPEELSGSRVNRVIAATGVETASIDTGIALLPAYAPDPGADAKVLPHLEDIEAEEQGIVFTNTSGQAVFHDRHHRFNAVTVGTIGDHAGLPYRDPQPADDDQFMFNSAHRVTQSGNSTGAALDSTSGTQHFIRDDTRTLLTDNANEAQAAAEAFVLRYKEPSIRISQVSIVGANTPSNWPTILSASNSDQFMFSRSFPTAGTINQLVFLEQVSESILPGQQWNTTWLLSPGTVDAYMSSRFWRVGNATYGHLGTFAIGW